MEYALGHHKTKVSVLPLVLHPYQGAKLLDNVRAHWSIENSLHWVLDIAFRKDDSRLRKDHNAENFAVLRRFAVSLLKQDTSVRAGIQNKRLRAGWDQDYLLRLISPWFS